MRGIRLIRYNNKNKKSIALRSLLLIFLSIFSLQADSIRIAIAANVSYAVPTLVHTFNQTHPDTKVQVTLGGTGKLVAQIRHGAPYDLLMAADMRYPQALYSEGLAIDKPRIYARGALSLLSTKERDFSSGLGVLISLSIHTIAIANPKTAPYGKASFEALQKAGLLEKLKPKFVYGESISQTVAHTVSAADVGFVASSSLYAPQMAQYREGKQWIVVDPSLYTPIDQGMVILSSAKANAEVKAWYDYMLSPEAGKILQQYGYTLP